MPRDPKSEMLRVRLTHEERTAMEVLIQRRGKGETISRFIRDVVIGSYITRGGKEPYLVSSSTREKLERLAALLNRPPDHVAEECIEGVTSMVEDPGLVSPLIVQEVKLRRRYSQGEG